MGPALVESAIKRVRWRDLSISAEELLTTLDACNAAALIHDNKAVCRPDTSGLFMSGSPTRVSSLDSGDRRQCQYGFSGV